MKRPFRGLSQIEGMILRAKGSLGASGVVVSLSLLVLSFPACVRTNEPRVAIVDVQYAFQHSPLGMASALLVRKSMGGAQNDLKKRGRSLAELRQRLEHGGFELDASQRREIETLIESETARLAELQSEYHAELAATQLRLGEEMIERVESVARDIAAREGFTLVFRKRDALYTAQDISAEELDSAATDITDEVIQVLLDKMNPERIPEPSTTTEP
jgi:Skp family chaperone for outer membrane proteins